MTQPTGEATIPQSTALAEASSDSLSELLSRDPEGYQQQDIVRVIEVMRQQRARFAQVEAETPSRQTKPKASSKAASLIAQVTAKDLDL